MALLNRSMLSWRLFMGTCLAALPAASVAAQTTAASSWNAQGQSDVYVADSTLAADGLALAGRLERLGDFAKAADVYQEILEKYAERLIAPDAQRVEGRFVAVGREVNWRLSRWPEPGLAIYRGKFEPAARALAQSPDAGQRRQVLDRYFVTQTAKTEALRWMDQLWESGSAAQAARLGERFLVHYPDLGPDRPGFLLRTALAWRLANQQVAAEPWARELREKYADARVMAAGTEQSAVALLEKAQVSAAPPAISAVPVRTDALLLSIVAQPPAIEQRATLAGQLRAAMSQSGQDLTTFAQLSGGILYYQDNATISAVDLSNGLPPARWTARPGRAKPENAGTMPLTLCLGQRDIVAVVNQPPRITGAQPSGAAAAGSVLCVRRDDGTVRWSMTAGQLPDSAKQLLSVRFCGTPLLMEGKVLVAARGAKANQMEDVYVFCFSQADGTYLWSTYLLSAMDGQLDMGEGPGAAMSLSELSQANGQVLVQTNLGAIAALDPLSGQVNWLLQYPRKSLGNVAGFRRPGGGWMSSSGNPLTSSPPPWAFTTPVQQGDMIFSLPIDSSALLIMGAQDGLPIKRIEASRLGDADTLLGVWDQWVLLTGPARLAAVDWKNAADGVVKDPAEDSNTVMLTNALPAVRGRGLIAGDAVLVATQDRLLRFSLNDRLARTGLRVVAMNPPSPRTWPPPRGPGNLLGDESRLVIASAGAVDVYGDLERMRTGLAEQIKLAPTDPQPLLKWAEVLFNATQSDEALDPLGKALHLINGAAASPASQVSQAARRRLFEDALRFAVLRAQGDAAGNDAKTTSAAGAYFDLAAQATDEPVMQARRRVAEARWLEQLKRPERALALWQEILQNPLWRDAAAGDVPPAGRAGDLAREAVESLVHTQGPQIYRAYAERAAAELEQAQNGGDAPRLIEIATAYPASPTAWRAWLVAARRMESAGDYAAANRLYRQARDSGGGQTPQLLEAMIRNYLRQPNRLSLAVKFAAQAAAKDASYALAQPMRTAADQPMKASTFGQLLTELEQLQRNEQKRALPHFRLPAATLKPRSLPLLAPSAPVENIEAIIAAEPSYSRWDRILLYGTDGTLSAYPALAAAPLWRAGGVEKPKLAGWRGDGLFTCWADKVGAWSGQGKVLWTVDAGALPAAAPPPSGAVQDDGGGGQNAGAQPRRRIMLNGNQPAVVMNGAVILLPMPQAVETRLGDANQWNHLAICGDGVMVAGAGGRLVCLAAGDGKLRWQYQWTGGVIERLEAAGEFVAVLHSDGNESHLLAMDAVDGRVVFNRSYAGQAGPGVQNIALGEDGMLVWTLDDALCGKDLYQPGDQADWQTTVSNRALPIFSALRRPDQLLLSDGRVIAVSNDKNSRKMVRLYSQQTGRALRYVPREGESAMEAILPVPSDNGDVHLRLAGDRLYAFSGKSLVSYHLDEPRLSWTKPADARVVENIRDCWVGRDYVVLANQIHMGEEINEENVHWRLDCFSRMILPNQPRVESGQWVFDPTIQAAAGVSQVVAVEGGFGFLTRGHQFCWLVGADSAAAPTTAR